MDFKQVLDILEVLTGSVAVVTAGYSSYRWLKRRSSVFLFFKRYCERRFFYFRSFVNKLIQKNISRPLPDGRFINYALALRNGFYAKDVAAVKLKFFNKTVDYQMPYKIIHNYITDPESRILIKGGDSSERFVMDAKIKSLTDPVLNEFLSLKPNTTDGPALRMKSLSVLEDGNLQCELQNASYFDQVRTNLTLDVPLNFEDTIRIIDLGEQNSLKEFSDSIMANTIGVSAVWFTECPNVDKDNRLRFFLMPRRKTTGVFTDMLGIISGVVEPPADGVFLEKTLEEYVEKEIRREFYQETGYAKYMERRGLDETCVSIFPLAFARELTRGGKPQFFFAINTPYIDEKEMADFFELSFNGQEEFYNDFRSRFVMYRLSPETLSNLLFAYSYIQRKQKLGYIDLS